MPKPDPLSDPNDYILDISSLKKPADSEASSQQSSDQPAAPQSSRTGAGKKPPFISVYFQCCHAYTRFYKSRDGKTYAGRCPKCMRQGSVSMHEVTDQERTFIAG